MSKSGVGVTGHVTTFTDWNGVLAELFNIDNVYLIDSPSQDSSSGIASDEHNTASATYDYISSGSETHCTKNKAYFESPQHSGYESDYVDLAEFSRTEVSRTKRQGERTDRGQTVIPGKGCPNKRSPWIGDRGSHELLNSEGHFLTKGSYVRERNNVWCEGDSHVIPKYDSGDVYRGSHLVDRNEAWTASRPRSGVVFTETNLDDSEAVHNSRAAPPGRIPGDRILTRDKQHVMRKPKIYVAHRQASSNVPTSQHVSAPTPRTSVPAGTRHCHISGNTPSSVRPPPQPKPLPARNSHRFVMPTLCYFDIVPDDVIIRILRHLGSEELCCVSAVCLRWYKLAWDPSLWTTIRLNKPNINTDRALNVLTKKISYQTPNVCAIVDRIDVHGSVRLTDRGLYTISRMCPDLRMLDLAGCIQISNVALWEVVSRCVNLERLNVAGCPNITSICLTPEATIQAATYGKQVYIHHLDMSDCQKVDDSCIQLLASYCTNLTTVYLRRCALVSDLGIQYLANYCTQLAELSISDCVRVTDFGLRELAKLGQNLRYLSIAKCERITDSGLSYIATYCTRLRYINIRGCHVTREAIDLLVRNSTKLRSLDLGKCDVTDGVLDTVSRHGIHLRKLSLRACEYITDRGLMRLASRCTQLRQLNLQGCNLTVEAYRTIKKCCRLCVIEHTNPGFY